MTLLNSVLHVKALVGAFNQEKALVGAFSLITNLRMDLFEELLQAAAAWVPAPGPPPVRAMVTPPTLPTTTVWGWGLL